MKCSVEGCLGEISKTPSVHLRTGCRGGESAYACNMCGRLHWANSEPVFNRQEHAAFLENGIVINRDENGQEMSRL